MKNQIQWLALVAGLTALIAGSLGCATILASSAANDHSDFYNKPILSDEIVAIGRPDESLSKTFGHPNVVAFLGRKNTYMLYKGGEELERIAQLKLDGRRMDIDAARSRSLYLKDKQVWGELVLTYGGGNEISGEERAELDKAGFSPIGVSKNWLYRKKVDIAGVISPAIQFSGAQSAQLSASREINLYNTRDTKPPMNVGATLMIPVAIAADIALAPVYLGVTAVVLVVGAVSGVSR